MSDVTEDMIPRPTREQMRAAYDWLTRKLEASNGTAQMHAAVIMAELHHFRRLEVKLSAALVLAEGRPQGPLS